MARTYYELHGVYPFKEIKKLVENLVQGSVITDYQKEQVDFQKEQVDIQKQMRDLLKMKVVDGEEEEGNQPSEDSDEDEGK